MNLRDKNWQEVVTKLMRFAPLSSLQVLTVSMTLSATQLDLIEELKLRRWARENYVPQPQRNGTWHPVVHDEMTRKDSESPATSLAS